jgi:hypothetical protein
VSDPNWFLSSAAQSAAAIVGIIGAFLVSRLTILAGERSSIERRVSDIENETQLKRSRLEYVEHCILRWDIAEFLDDHLEEIVESRGEVQLKDLLLLDRSTSRTEGELQPEFEKAVGIVKRAFSDLDPKVRTATSDFPEGVFEFATATGVDLFQTEEEEVWYQAVYVKLVRERKEEERKRRPWGLGIDDIVSPFSPELAAARMQIDAAERTQRTQTRGDFVREKDSLETQLVALLVEKERVANLLKGVARPPGLWGAVFVLSYFAVTGVLIPIALMPAGADAFQASAKWKVVGVHLSGVHFRWLVLAGFTSGLVLVLGYFVWAVRRLIRGIPKAEAPSREDASSASVPSPTGEEDRAAPAE